jgi:hypothetical protein
LDAVLPGISAKSPAYLGWLSLLLKLIDLPLMPNRLTVHCVLKPLEHRLEVLEACLDRLETLRRCRVRPAGIGRDSS